MNTNKRLCPECSTEMQSITVGIDKKTEIEKCPNCEGLFFDNQELQDLVSSLKEYPVDSTIRFDTKTANGSIWDREQYKCPICGEKMQKAYYEVKSSVAFDYCLGHGVYLNKGELTAIIRWKKENKLANKHKDISRINKRINRYRQNEFRKNRKDSDYEKVYFSEIIDTSLDILWFLIYIFL